MKPMRSVLPSAITWLLLFVLPTVVFADRRGHVWTYEYMTLPKGGMELEYYLTTKVPDASNYSAKNTWEHQLEFEYGITNHWDVALYQHWQQTNTTMEDKFEYTGTKLRTRYRFSEKDIYPVDVLVYLEYKRPDGSQPDDSLEGKLILAKDLGKFNLAYNQILEQPLRQPDPPVHEYSAGANYEFHPAFKAGVESHGNYSSSKYYLGPTLSVASERFWLAFGVLAGLNNRADDIRSRLIAGIPIR